MRELLTQQQIPLARCSPLVKRTHFLRRALGSALGSPATPATAFVRRKGRAMTNVSAPVEST
eukprot:scaffold87341_cov57-Phaeocystis_antarctica.AAC.1